MSSEMLEDWRRRSVHWWEENKETTWEMWA